MSLASAQRFILQASEDASLRSQLNGVGTREQLEQALESAVGGFSLEDFEEAFNSLHVRCQHASQASELHEIRLWWHLLVAAVG
jgi:hypothetical protein